MKNQIQASVFKAHCLKVLDDVKKTGKEYTITKRGKPYARLVPIKETVEPAEIPLFGKMKGTISFLGDIVHATGEE